MPRKHSNAAAFAESFEAQLTAKRTCKEKLTGTRCDSEVVRSDMDMRKTSLVRSPDWLFHPHRRRVSVGLCLLLGVMLIPSPAAAHGLEAVGADMSVWDFVMLGITHMAAGWDHLLFIAGVLLLARNVKRAAKMITAFVIGHSTTLIVATLAGWQVNPGWVDAIIVVSVVFVGLLAVLGGTTKYNALTAVVFAFGLVHGLGLATRLQAVGLPEDGLLWRVLGFNLGIEIGQLSAIALISAVGLLVLTLINEPQAPLLGKFAGAAVLMAGAVALPLVVLNAATTDDEASTPAGEEAAEGSENCTVAPRSSVFPPGGGHTEKSFYEPTESAPLEDFGHSLGDGYVVILYSPDLPETDVSELRSYVTGRLGLLAGPSTDAESAVTATNMNETLTCEKYEVQAVLEFAGAWLGEEPPSSEPSPPATSDR